MFARPFAGGVLAAVLVAASVLVAPGAASAADATALSGATVSRVVGGSSSCALAADQLVCWGRNDNGTLADGTTTDHPLARTVPLLGTALDGAAVLDVSGGGDHACAVSDAGAVACWGDNQHGQLGIGTINPAGSPAELAAVDVPTAGTPLESKTVVQVVTGTSHTCALTSDSAIACWGANPHGELGDGTLVDRAVPTPVLVTSGPLDGRTVVSLVAGSHHTCALTADSVIACWGAGSSGQLGRGSTTQSPLPVAVTTVGTPLDGIGVVDVVAGANHTCALSWSGYVSCWGSNAQGALGNGGGPDRTTPTAVLTGGTVIVGRELAQIAAAGQSTCVVATDGFLACWGDNSTGNLGDGTTTSRSEPTAVLTTGTRLRTESVVSLSMGDCTLVATDAGRAMAWGYNAHGCVGDGTTTTRTRPVTVATGLPTAPQPPSAVNATATGSTITADWTPPFDDGGSAVTGYRVVLLKGGAGGAAGTVVSTKAVLGTITSAVFTAVTPGGPYTVVVYAQNELGESVASDPSEQVAVDLPTGSRTTLSFKPDTTLLTAGRLMGISTTLTAVPRGTATGFAVQLWQRVGTGAWSRVCSVRTSSTGVARCTVKPSRTTSYQWRFAGVELQYLASTSATVKVSVKISISAALSPTSIRLGKASTLSGSFAPHVSKGRVYLQIYSNHKWVNVTSVLSSSTSVFKFTIKPKKKGSFSYRAFRYGDSTVLSNGTTTKVLRVT